MPVGTDIRYSLSTERFCLPNIDHSTIIFVIRFNHHTSEADPKTQLNFFGLPAHGWRNMRQFLSERIFRKCRVLPSRFDQPCITNYNIFKQFLTMRRISLGKLKLAVSAESGPTFHPLDLALFVRRLWRPNWVRPMDHWQWYTYLPNWASPKICIPLLYLQHRSP